MKNQLIYHFLSDDDLIRIADLIGRKEKTTSGEIRVSVKEKKPFLHRNKSIEYLARKEFFRLKMDNTRDKTGVLIFILLSERQFHILGDSGINEKIGEKFWGKIKDEMQNKFRSGKFSEGVLYGVDQVGDALSQHFPIKEDDTNELPNNVVF